MKIEVVKRILESNDTYAEKNRLTFKENGVFAINMISSPGAGKTSVLEALLPLLQEQIMVAVIEGDLYTTKDAERIETYGVDVVQINTEGACHLDAKMIFQAIRKLTLSSVDLLIIENVGNLVCPAEFDIGEMMKLHVASITEGNDKPLKYPLIYEKADVVLLNKTDLLSYTDFDVETYKSDLYHINPTLMLFELSARKGTGVKEVAKWLTSKVITFKSGVKSVSEVSSKG